ncbi:MAG: hypothetical protein OYH77_08905 [Pseudomonadota bacterium]|nr:hypothetical protein [Pseudomonadota bacterium]
MLAKGIGVTLPAYGQDSLCIATVDAHQYHQLLSKVPNNLLLCVFTDGEFTVAQMYEAGQATQQITAQRWRSAQVLVLRWQGEQLRVVVGALPAVQEVAQTISGRLLLLALATLVGERWCDGYLAHVNAGKILSYVARPGYLCLRVPVQARACGLDLPPTGWQQDWDYLALQQALRVCWRRELSLYLDDFSRAAAVCLVAAVKTLAPQSVWADVPNPAWRRLLQNLGLQVHAVSALPAANRLPISTFLPLLAKDKVATVIASINRRGVIIPLL